jgi:transposase
MAFLRVENKKSGTYLRIVESYKDNGKPKHRTLHSLGKVEDYPPEQLESIAKKLLECAGVGMKDIVAESFEEVARVNYGYALIIKRLWKLFNMNLFVAKVNIQSKVKFDWMQALQIMVAERINDPVSKRQSYFNQEEYIGFGDKEMDLQHFYRTMDLLSSHQELLKEHLFTQQQNLFLQELDVVFYDVTTLYFDSQKEDEDSIRQKGYSKDGKAHKTQVVLGLLVDKMRNPITYNIYRGDTYEGGTMIDALKDIKQKFNIDNVVAVADSAMIDKDNREYMQESEIDYILGDSVKKLPAQIQQKLVDKQNHKQWSASTDKSEFSYIEVPYQGRTIICTYSAKRARKDKAERDKLIAKAEMWLSEPGKYKQVTKRGAGRFISTDEEGSPIKLDIEKIEQDAKYDGFKAISTTTQLEPQEVISKYADLFEVEHAFRTLKSQLKVKPIYHWNTQRIEGHIAMCFVAYTFLNYLRNTSGMQYRNIVKSIDRMQMSVIKEDKSKDLVYMRANLNDSELSLLDKLKIASPKTTTPQRAIDLLFK